jgi:glycosyltransferase involved in cell wall biosynthesis
VTLKNNFDRCLIFLSHSGAGGIATYQAHQINYLLKKGENLILIDSQPEITLSNKCFEDVERKYIGVLNISTWEHPCEVFNFINQISSFYKKVFIFISNPSLLFIYSYFLFKIHFKNKFRIIITLHSKMIFRLKSLQSSGESFTSFLLYLFSDQLIFVSNYTKSYWSKYNLILKCKSTVINNGVVPALRIKSKQRAKKLRVVYVGRFAEDKDPEQFCMIARESHKRDLRFSFHMYGDGPLLDSLRYGYSNFVSFHGWLEESRIYKESDLLLVTSPIENSPYSVLEAKNYGIPVIARRSGGIPEVVSDQGDALLIEEWSIDEVLKSISRIDENFEFFSKRCLDERHLYSSDRAGEKLMKLISSIS